MSEFNDIVELALPMNAAYVSAARLTASSIANRMRFDIDQTEDIKAAVSEACTFLIRQVPRTSVSTFFIRFKMNLDSLDVVLETDKPADYSLDTDDYGTMMLKVLMDSVSVQKNTEGKIQIIMHKKKAQSAF